MKKTLISFLLAMWCFTTLSAQESGKGISFHDNTPWKEILHLAQKENKLIFMDCYTSWCGPCKALAKNVFTQEKVGEFFNPRFINVKYDMEKGDGKMLNEKYKKYIVGYPTLLLLNAEGDVLQQLAGFKEADELIEGIKQASEGKDLFSLAAEYQQGNREIGFMKDFIQSLNNAFLKDSVARVANQYIRTLSPKDLDKDDVWEVFGSYVTDVRSDAFEYLVNNADRYQRKLKRDRYAINKQLEISCERELRMITKLSFDNNDVPLTLSEDTVFADKLIYYMDKASLRNRDRHQTKLAIHKLLLKKQYDEAWQLIVACKKLGIGSYYPTTIQDYIRYLLYYTNDKKALKAYLDVLEEYWNHGEGKEFNYHMYETMSHLHRKLGHRKQADELMAKYRTIDEERQKEAQEIFKRY